MQTIMGLTQPVIAEVCGIAAAAGCQLVASCDLAVASEQATFMTPGVNIGLFCSTPMVAVSRNISRKKMMEMLLTGEKLSAKEAVDFGLVNHCVSFDKLENKTLALADLIASKPRSTVTIGKEAFYKQLEMPVVEAYNYTSEVMAMNMLELDAQEGINAFLEKRVPSWNE
jgi:enoyl-CoA hydratase/carnithine racemase